MTRREVLDETLNDASSPLAAHLPCIRLGRLTGLDEHGRALVEIDGIRAPAPIPALCATEATLSIGDTVALSFVDGDPERPVVVGRLCVPRVLRTEGTDGLLIQHEKRITLRCGNSSLILTSAGKLLLRGDYVSSHSSGLNRIKGGSVQIN